MMMMTLCMIALCICTVADAAVELLTRNELAITLVYSSVSGPAIGPTASTMFPLMTVKHLNQIITFAHQW